MNSLPMPDAEALAHSERLADLIRSEIAIFTTFAYTPADFRESIRHIESKQITLCPWTESRSMDEGQSSFEKMTRSPGATLKLILRI